MKPRHSVICGDNVVALAAQAQERRSAASRRPEPYQPGLGEIMALQQMRHIKLWYAGRAGNWPLADYEIGELNEGFEDVKNCSAAIPSSRMSASR